VVGVAEAGWKPFGSLLAAGRPSEVDRPARCWGGRFLVFVRSALVLGATDLRFGDGLDGRRQIASTATVRPQLRQRAVRVDHAPKDPEGRPDEPHGRRWLSAPAAARDGCCIASPSGSRCCPAAATWCCDSSIRIRDSRSRRSRSWRTSRPALAIRTIEASRGCRANKRSCVALTTRWRAITTTCSLPLRLGTKRRNTGRFSTNPRVADPRSVT
jgi:hypothetical protein